MNFTKNFNMTLELAEGMSARKGRGRFYNPNIAKHRAMMNARRKKFQSTHHLPKPHFKPNGVRAGQGHGRGRRGKHVFIPPHLNDGISGVYVREDHLDCLSDNDWDTLMDNIADHDPALSDLSSKARRAEKRAIKDERRKSRVARKNTKANSKADARKARAEAKRLKGQAKVDKANNKGGGDSEAESIFDKVVDKASGAFKKFKGGGADSADAEADAEDGADGASGGGSRKGGGADAGDTIFGLPKMPVIIGGVALLGLVGLIIMKKK